MFYDDQISYAGHINSLSSLQAAVARNGPRGGTYVTEALRGAIQKYKTKRGLYVIVITDGEFADKLQVRQLILQEILPQMTPENPYAFRLHFVGAGEGVDHQFLRQIEADASGQGIPLVTQHHHAHLSHSHDSILDELDKAFIGVGTDARFGSQALLAGPPSPGATDPVISHTSEPLLRRSWDGGVGTPGFLPRRVLAWLRVRAGSSRTACRLPCSFRAQTAEGTRWSSPCLCPARRQRLPHLLPSKKPGFHLPWGPPHAGRRRGKGGSRAAAGRDGPEDH